MSNKSRLKSVYILLAGLSLGFLGLVSVALWYVNTDHFRSLLLEQLNRMIPGSVAVTDHHLALNTGELFLSNAAIRDQNSDDLVRIDFLSIDLSPLALFRKTVIVDSVNIEHPRVRLYRDGAGRLNLVRAFATGDAQKEATEASASAAPFKVIIRHLSLSDGYVSYSEAGKQRRLTLQGVDIFANGDLSDRSGVVKMGIGKSSVEFKGKTIHLNHFDLALALRKGHIEPLVMTAQNQFASLLAYGDIYDAFSDPDVDLALDLECDLKEAEAFFGYDRGDTGQVKALLNVKGKPDNPQVNLVADYDGGMLTGRPVGAVGLEAQLIDRVATLAKLSADADFGLLELSGRVDMRKVYPQGILSPPGDWDASAFNGSLSIRSLDLSALPLDSNSIEGSMDALLNFTGKGFSLDTLTANADAKMAIQNFRTRGMVLPTGIRSNLNGGVDAGTFRLDTMQVTAADASVSAQGSLDLVTEQIDAGFRLEIREAGSLFSLFGLPEIKGAVMLDGLVNGTFENPALNVSATGKAVRIQGIDMENVSFEAGLDDAGRLKVPFLTVETKGSYLQADGEIQLFAAPFERHPDMPLKARLAFSNVEYDDFLARAFPELDINGSMEGEVALSGNLRSLKARADILAREVEVKGIRLGNVKGKARFADGSLVMDSIRLTNNRSVLDASGKVELLRQDSWQTIENPAIKLNVKDSHIFLEDFREELSGEVKIDANLKGRFKTLRGRLDLTGRDLDLGIQRLDALTLNLHTADRQVTVEMLDVVMPDGGVVKGTGRVNYDKSFQFSLQAHGLPVKNIDRVREMKVVGGHLDIDIQGTGSLHRPEIAGKAAWRNIRIRDEAIADMQLQFGLKDNRIHLDAKHTSDLFAEYDLSSKAFSMDLLMNNMRLAPWFAIAGRPELGGRISGSLRAQGNADNLKQSRAAIDVRSLDLEFNGDRFAGTKDLKGTFNKGKFNIPIFYMDLLEQGHLAIEGSGDISGKIDLNAEGEIPLKAANMIAADLPALKGTLLVMASVAGSLEKPDLEGVVRVDQGGMEIPDLQQRLHRVDGEIRFTADEDVTGHFSGFLDDGRFDLEAKIDLDGFRARWIDARATAAALPFQIPDTMEMLLKTDLSVNGSPDDLLVGGEIILLEGSYYKDFKLNLLQSVPEKERDEIPRAIEEPHPFLKPLRFDVHLKRRQPFVVDNNIADMEISPDMVLTGTVENPVITGSAKVDSGIITYQNKNFEIQQGIVNFVNPYQTEAEIDIEGEVEVRDWLIAISLYGPPDSLVVELSSVPQEEDADIISLIVFNKTTYELNEGGNGADQSPAVLLSRLLAASFGEDIKKSAGIDVLEVEAESAQDEDSTDRIKVTVGKDLSERMTVKYSVESKDGGYVHRAATEYKLLEHIIVSGFQDTKGVYGGELIFRVRFRLFR